MPCVPLHKEELVNRIVTLQEDINDNREISNGVNENLLSMLKNVQEEIKDVKNLVIELKTENTKLKKKIDDVEDVNEKLVKRVINVEKEHWKNAQYGRHNNVELSGIPDSVEDSE